MLGGFFLSLRGCLGTDNRLPREAVDASFREVFKATLDVAQGNLTWWVASSP